MTEKLSTRKPGPIAEKLVARESFKTNGELKGVSKPEWFDFGKMSVMDYAKLQFYNQFCGIDYVIYSYTTPIAWLCGDGRWVMPEADYTPTTKHHKATIRDAIKAMKEVNNG